MNKKIVFMGTPLFSSIVLERLIKDYEVILVVTQPDKEVGRKKVLTPCITKEVALKNGIEVFTPKRLKDEYEYILSLKPDIIITCAYGQMLPIELINNVPYKVINVHASLLPKYRGGAPIERAIMNGDDITGITIMESDASMDGGAIITSKSIDIDIKDNKESLSKKLAILGSELLIDTLPSIFANTCIKKEQDDTLKSFAPIIKRSDEYLDFNKTSQEIYNHVRGLYPNPACYAILDGVEVKILEVEIGDKNSSNIGEIINVYKDGIGVGSKDKEIIIKKLQMPGKKVMAVKDYLNGINKDNLLGKNFS